MESLQNILGGRDFTPPDEIELVKEYVLRRYASKCSIRLQHGNLVLSVPNSSLASTIRLEQIRLIEACKLKSRLVIRIGQ